MVHTTDVVEATDEVGSRPQGHVGLRAGRYHPPLEPPGGGVGAVLR